MAKLEPCTVIIQRRHILSSVFRAVQEPDFDFHRPLTVIFSGEDATDEGGQMPQMKEAPHVNFSGYSAY